MKNAGISEAYDQPHSVCQATPGPKVGSIAQLIFVADGATSQDKWITSPNGDSYLHQFLLRRRCCTPIYHDAFIIFQYALFNLVSVVAIILANKTVFSEAIGFHFPTALLCIHVGVTYIGLYVCALSMP